MILAQLPIRGGDRHGAGHWHASRGTELHRGIDLACYPDTGIASPVDGIVTKIGYPYGDDLSYRYVQVTATDRRDHRFFYIRPAVSMQQTIRKGDILGHTQSLDGRYPGITEHCHYEIKRGGQYFEPYFA